MVFTVTAMALISSFILNTITIISFNNRPLNKIMTLRLLCFRTDSLSASKTSAPTNRDAICYRMFSLTRKNAADVAKVRQI